MSDVCKFCGSDDEVSNDVCDPCYYGMRFEPESWERRMSDIGRAVVHRGGCVITDLDGSPAIVCRDPYVPAPVLVKE